jgi:glutaminase
MNDTSPTPRPAAPIQTLLEKLHARFATLDAGQVASYIPELARADPADFGIVIATVDGQVYEVGQSRRRFTIQSVSKPLVYGAALEDCGREVVQRSVGVEPSGEAFNSISLEPGTGRPLNPMINAGAIAIASLIKGATPQARLARVVDALSAYAGRPLEIDAAVYESERSTGHRNRAIGHMLRSHGIIEDDPEPALELYFRQCSLLVDCRDLALMAATLANGGVHPVSGQQAVSAEYISSILSVMATCGIYDFTGEWVYRVGLPAKSGVGGGILAVLPGQLGIGVFSPPLDERGNSVRGVKVCEAMSSELELHFLHPPRVAGATVRARYTLAAVRSRRRRPAAENALLDAHGAAARVYELQGDLRFGTIEPLLREVASAEASLQFLMLDFNRVAHADPAATRLLARQIERCAANGQQVVLTRVRRGELLAGLGAEVDPRCARAYGFHSQIDLGLEACERGLLARHAVARVPVAIDSLWQHRLCSGASADDVAHLATLVGRCSFGAGDTLLRRGDPADALYLLMRGEVSVVVPLAQGGHKRLATLSAGMAFGESALVAGGRRSADVNADTEVECLTLSAADFARLETGRPSLAVTLLHNLLRGSAEATERLTVEVAALEG